MTPGLTRNALAPFGMLAAFAAVLGAAVNAGRGQPPAAREGESPALKRSFVSAQTCAQCHTKPPDFRPEVGGAPQLPRLVLRTEFKTWNEGDKHRRAFDALKGKRGQAMGVLLGFGDVTGERSCLSCHASGFERDDPPAEQERAMLSRGLGIGCTSCHGPYREWVKSHFFGVDADPEWRNKAPEEKARVFGMTDLRDPATRAGVCSSCHVGDSAGGKVVTHAMYAAGHPPLPGIEVATFLEAMPPHWLKPDQVDAFQKDRGLREKYHVNLAEPQATKAVVIGGVVALRDEMRLLAIRSEPEPTPLGSVGPTWPDSARFDCYACHHDLEAPGNRRRRQARGFDHRFDGLVVTGVPGRPQIRPWPLALARLALAQTGGTGRDAYREAVKDLYAALDARPFGDPSAVHRAAKRLEAWSREMLESLNGSRFDASTPPRLLAALVSVPAGECPDYDSARQVAWAIRSIDSDWQPRPANDARIREVLAELDRALKLNPYADREPRSRLITSPELSGDPLRDALLRLSEGEFRTSLARAADYDPDHFKAALGRLESLFSEAKAAPPVR